MIAVYRWILGLLKREHVLRTNYHKSHPHFLLYIVLDALLSFGLVFGGFQIFRPHVSIAEELVEAGAVTISADGLIVHVKENNLDAYWLGPISGNEYAMNHEMQGVVDIFYLPETTAQSNWIAHLHAEKKYRYEVKTYRNQGVWDAHTHPLLATSNTTTIKINKVLSIKINRSSMKGEIATLTGHSEIIAIAYPTAQSLDTMIQNAKNLTPIH